jgi:hypothetical protein
VLALTERHGLLRGKFEWSGTTPGLTPHQEVGMSKRFPTLIAALALAVSAPLAAQGRSTVSPADLDAAIATSQSETRARVEQFVKTAEVRDAAEKLGISQATLSAKVAELDGTTLNTVAQQIDLAQAPLAGGINILGIGLVGILLIILLIVLI